MKELKANSGSRKEHVFNILRAVQRTKVLSVGSKKCRGNKKCEGHSKAKVRENKMVQGPGDHRPRQCVSQRTLEAPRRAQIFRCCLYSRQWEEYHQGRNRETEKNHGLCSWQEMAGSWAKGALGPKFPYGVNRCQPWIVSWFLPGFLLPTHLELCLAQPTLQSSAV